MGIFEPIPFKGNENMLVDASNRVVKDEDDEETPTRVEPTRQPDMLGAPVSQPSAPVVDMGLDDLLGGPSVPSQPVAQQPVAAPAGGMTDLMDIFGGPAQPQPVSQPVTQQPAGFTPGLDIFGGPTVQQQPQTSMQQPQIVGMQQT